MSVVEMTQDGRVLHAKMVNPPANPLTTELIAGLAEAAEAFESSDAKVLVISSGVEGLFAAGADIAHMASVTPEGLAEYRDALRAPMWRLAASDKVSIAAIDGMALGGGLELAMACSLRLASARSQLGVPEVKLGLIPGAGGTQRLPRLVGRGKALEMTLTGRSVPAPEAFAMGLVDRLVEDEDVTAFALDYAARISRFPSSALTSLLRCADAADGDLDAGLDFEGEEIVRMLAEGEGREGLTAFLEKRRPTFS